MYFSLINIEFEFPLQNHMVLIYSYDYKLIQLLLYLVNKNMLLFTRELQEHISDKIIAKITVLALLIMAGGVHGG